MKNNDEIVLPHQYYEESIQQKSDSYLPSANLMNIDLNFSSGVASQCLQKLVSDNDLKWKKVLHIVEKLIKV